MVRMEFPVWSPVRIKSVLSGASALARSRTFQLALESVRADLASVVVGRQVAFLDSGTSALAEALSWCARAGKHRIALPAFVCFDVATAARKSNVDFMLYDVDPGTLAPDFDSLRDRLESGADVVVIAHLYGHPANIGRAAELAREYDAIVVEDAAQRSCGRDHGRPLGALGDVTVLSFGRGKGTTGGGGGAVILPESAAVPNFAKSRMQDEVRALLAATAQSVITSPSLFGVLASLPLLGIGETQFREPQPTFGMPKAAVGVLAHTLALRVDDCSRRKSNARYLLDATRNSPLKIPILPPQGEAGYLRLPVSAPAALTDVMRGEDWRRLGVLPSYPSSLDRLEGFGRLQKSRCIRGYPGAEQLSRELFTLPVHQLLSDDALKRLANELQRLS